MFVPFLKLGETIGEAIFYSALAIFAAIIVPLALILSIIELVLRYISKKICRKICRNPVDEERMEDMDMTVVMNVSTNKVGKRLLSIFTLEGYEMIFEISSMLKPKDNSILDENDPLKKFMSPDIHGFDNFFSREPVHPFQISKSPVSGRKRTLRLFEKVKEGVICSSAGIIFVISILLLAETRGLISISSDFRLAMIFLLGIASIPLALAGELDMKIRITMIILPLLLLLDLFSMLATLKELLRIVTPVMLILHILILVLLTLFLSYEVLRDFEQRWRRLINSIRGFKPRLPCLMVFLMFYVLLPCIVIASLGVSSALHIIAVYSVYMILCGLVSYGILLVVSHSKEERHKINDRENTTTLP